jgi:hypothetical protein
MRLSPGQVQSCPQETLGDIVRDIIRRQIAICLAVWLAVLVPVSCEHHVVMTLADHIDAPISQHDHGGSRAPNQTLCTPGQHDTSPRAMTLLTLFAGVVPVTICLQAFVGASALQSASALSIQLPDFSPLDPPPRSIYGVVS